VPILIAGLVFSATIASATDASNGGNGPCHGSFDLYEKNPVLCRMLDRTDDEFLRENSVFATMHNLLVGHDWQWEEEEGEFLTTTRKEAQLPVVMAHGMGDSCFNSGMINIGKHTSSLLGNAYVTCIPTGDTKSEDTKNGYFLNMDASVDVFATKIMEDPKLKKGFHAIGFSQGNNVIRGYIARFNTPTVHTFISVNGVNAGEGTVPGCFPDNGLGAHGGENERIVLSLKENFGSICDLLLEQASHRAYTDFAQEHSFQANYWRDPRQKMQESYQKYSQLARWNNEGPDNNNQTFNENYGLTKKFVWIMASLDSMVWPKEGEHWGAPDLNDPFENKILPYNQTQWYISDSFGLKTAQEAGKNVFETFQGDHLQFSMEEFDRWINTYIKQN